MQKRNIAKMAFITFTLLTPLIASAIMTFPIPHGGSATTISGFPSGIYRKVVIQAKADIATYQVDGTVTPLLQQVVEQLIDDAAKSGYKLTPEEAIESLQQVDVQ